MLLNTSSQSFKCQLQSIIRRTPLLKILITESLYNLLKEKHLVKFGSFSGVARLVVNYLSMPVSCKYIAFEAFIINRPFGHLRMAANILGRNGEAPASAEGQKDGEHDAAMEEEKLIGTIAWRASQPRRTGRCGAWAVRSVVRGDSVSDKGAGFGRQNGSDSAS
ncbi:uncharacterized protein CIMG_11277 [Coccidioides immitis RS]|uniref:Uncharacterized protein n=1 Tax=Coccidioides immitis (strain RS) TaxID=246410 RepID=A0A0D8JWE1_COCIM|nr:uncharacterized protein CIMG_11277 [Coccidioides immitis RS]KJF61617.1 hypothetical protein CIMG_11277 [Coccidioides immitis RS]